MKKDLLLKTFNLILGLVVISAVLTANVSPGIAGEIHVPNDHPNIQAAITAAIDGDLIIVQPGTYYENINYSGKAITVKSTDPNNPSIVAATIIDGNQTARVVSFDDEEGNETVLNGVTVRNGLADNGGGIRCYYSSPTITNCNINNNSASADGGGIDCDHSSPNITNCKIIQNSASNDGGGIKCYHSSPIIIGCIISDNSASSYGGGIESVTDSMPTISNCTIFGNSASIHGGGIRCYNSSPTITNSAIEQNSGDRGGGIFYSYSSLTIIDSTIKKNSASSHGGGISSSYSTSTISNCSITENSAFSYGGGIFCYDSSPAITECSINGNKASIYGGGVYSSLSTPNINNCTINTNTSSDCGGGIFYRFDSSPTITNCTIKANTATNSGGGIYGDSGSLSINSCTINSNSASSNGGALYLSSSSSPPTISNCTLRGNHASNYGGGMYWASSSPTITNCAIIKNTADTEGGGIYCSSSSAAMNYCTIAGNSSIYACGGIYCYSGSSVVITNCILWDTRAISEIAGPGTPTITYSNILGGYPGTGNISTYPSFIDPIGGDYHLRADSPCIDAGSSTDCPSMDIESNLRPLEGDGDSIAKCDMGAYEYDGPPPPSLPEEIHVNAEQSIQAAIDAAWAGDVIIVQPGTYYENINFLGKSITIRSIDPNDPAVVAATIIDGSKAGSVVTFRNGEGSDAVLSGFNIKNGKYSHGGGIQCHCQSSPSITKCNIVYNIADGYGGGISCAFSSSPTILNCTIRLNSATSWGGGIFCTRFSNPNIINCTINSNSATTYGGGIYCYQSFPVISHCTINANKSSDEGGGIFCRFSSSPTINHCTINGNSASSSGGGIYGDTGSLIITNCTINGNLASSNGGGIYLSASSSPPTISNCTLRANSALNYGGGMYWTSSSPTVTNCVLIKNRADTEGGGMYCSSSSPTITNCTFVGNWAVNACGGIYCGSGSSVVVTNCILWDYYATEIAGPATPTITYSNILGGYPGIGNISAYPCFIDPMGLDYHLRADSPCIDSGSSAAYPSTDMEGRLRPFDGDGEGTAICDMGAYEYEGPPPPSSTEEIHVNPGYRIQAAIDNAWTGDTIIIHPGIYYENINFLGKSITVRSTDPNDPTAVAATIIDGSEAGCVAIFANGEGSEAILSGITLKNGKDQYGGGIRCSYRSAPTITKCMIIGNSTETSGAGIRCSYSSPTIKNCTITGNAASSGGGIICYYSTPNILDCIINSNSASSYGGGIYCYESSPNIAGCTINWNKSSDTGGGIHCRYSSSPTITGCTINGNSAANFGGGIYSDTGSFIINNCTINGNFGASNGGGIYISSPSSPPIISNCTLRWNNVSNYGGGIYCTSSSLIITNCAILKNWAATQGAGMYCASSSPTITYSTIAGNSSNACGGIFCGSGSSVIVKNSILWDYAVSEIDGPATPTITYSAIRGGYPGTGNISSSPCFIDPIGGDYHLRADSLCVDAASSTGCPSTDMEGRPRPFDGDGDGVVRCDMGIYEYDGPLPPQAPQELNVYTGYSIQAAIEAAWTGDVIIIHPGIYYENINFLGKSITVRSTDPNDQVVVAATIIDGNEAGSVVAFKNGEGSDTVLSGITIKNGNQPYGGGIQCHYQCSPTITKCVIMNNKAEGYESGNHGGGISFVHSAPIITNCIIKGNSAGAYGGGIFCYYANANINDCIIIANSAFTYGGGIYCSRSAPNITNCTIQENVSSDSGGGVFGRFSSSPTINNSLIIDNLASSHGGGLYFDSDSASVTNCTLAGNSALSAGDGLYCASDASVAITHCIFWDKTSNEISGPVSPAVCYTNIRGGYAGTENINSKPLFVDPNTGDYHLLEASPCIDAGASSGTMVTDKDGVLRPLDGDGDGLSEYDMGAYEFFPYPTVVSHFPSKSVKSPTNYLDLFFHKSIDPATFEAGDVSILGPSGTIVPDSLDPLSETDNKGFRILFSSQNEEGIYTFIIGPQILDLDGNPMDQDKDGINNEPIEDQYKARFTIDDSGPQITATSISGIQTSMVGIIDLTFTESMDPNSFPVHSVTISGPQGNIDVVQVTPISSHIFRITLTPLQMQMNGLYSVDILPVITDQAGNFLDQDGDGQQGEQGEDLYSFTFVQQLPDLEVTHISFPLEVKPGDSMEIGWTVTNVGTGQATGQWTDTIFLSDDQALGNDQVLGQAHYDQPLDSGQSYIRALTVTIPGGIAGRWWLIIQVNKDKTLVEQGGDTNNTMVAASSLWIMKPHIPDLQVIQVAGPETLSSGEKERFSWTVQNSGLAATNAPYWHDKLYLSLDPLIGPEDIELAYIQNADCLLPGDSYTQTCDLIIPPSLPKGTYYYILVKTDADGQVEEYDFEENNIGQGANTVQVVEPSPAILDVVNVDLSPNPVIPGDFVTVTWTVQNTGGSTVTIRHIDHGILLSMDEVLDFGKDRGLCYHVGKWAGLYEPGEHYTASYNVRIPERCVGNYFIIPWPDPSLQTGLDKHLIAAPLTVEIPDPPDLIISSITLPDFGASGQEANITWTVKNSGQGITRTSPWEDALFLSDDQFLDSNDLALGSIPYYGVLDPNQMYEASSASLRLPAGIEGSYYVLIHTDPNNFVYETNETNNIGTGDLPMAISIVESDLQIQAFSGPSEGCAGDLITVDWTVINGGEEATAISNWIDKAYLSSDANINILSDALLGACSRTGFLEAGQTYTRCQQLRLPQHIEGNYYLIIAADADNALYEHNGEDNNTPSMLLTITDPAADLMVEYFSAPSSGHAGQPIQVDWIVRNEGAHTALPAWKDYIYLSQDTLFIPEADILIAALDHTESLAQGSQYGPGTSPYAIILPSLPNHYEGDYYLFYIADGDQSVYEKGDEGDNISSPHLINLSEYSPDLQVLSANAPGQGIAGETIEVEWQIINQGSADAEGWHDALYLSDDTVLNITEDILCGIFEQKQTLGQGQTTGPPTQPAQILLPEKISGTYHLFVVTDIKNSVYEKNAEDNNTFHVPTPITISIQAPDLRIQSVNAPLSAKTETAVTITWMVKNSGQKSTHKSFWEDGVYLSADRLFDPNSDIELGLAEHTGVLAVNGVYGMSKIFTLPKELAGPYRVYVVTDKGNRVFEHNQEGNNISAAPGSMQIVQTLVDLQINALAAPTTCYQGEAVEITWTVGNAGIDGTTSFSWEDAVYLSTNGDLDEGAVKIQTFIHQGSLDSGETYSSTKIISLPREMVGNYYFIIKTDSGTPPAVFEYGKEDNNTASSAMVIDPAPASDLKVTGISIPDTAWSGQNLTVGWTVLNEGSGPASAISGFWHDTLYLSRDPYLDRGMDRSLGNKQYVGSLSSGASYTQSLTAKLPGGVSGPYFLIVETDSSVPERVFEGSQENNNLFISPKTLEIQLTPPADLVVTSITPPTNGIYGEEADFSYQVKNIGDLEAQDAWYDVLYLSKDQIWDLADHPVEIIYHQGNLIKDQTYSETITTKVPGVLPGNYYVLALTDILDDVRETDNTNNTAASTEQITVEGRELLLDFIDSNTIARAQAIYYQITMEEEKDLIISLSGDAKDTVELFVACDRIPSRSDSDVKGEKDLSGNLQARILGTRAATYYILIYGYDCPDPAPSYGIVAHLPDHSIEDLSLSEGGNTGPVTVAISGYNYTPKTKAYLKDPNGIIIATGEVSFQDSGSLSATFDLAGATAGNYHIELENPDGSFCSKDFDVVEGKGGRLDYQLVMPNLVRPGRPYTAILEYGNSGYADIRAPLFSVSADAGIVHRLFSSEEFHSDPIMALGIADDNPIDILPPGTSYTIEMEFKLTSNNMSGFIYLGALQDSDDPVKWKAFNIRPQDISPDIWEPVWAKFSAQIGGTWGDFVAMLQDNASYLGRLGDRVFDVRELLSFEILQTIGLGEPKILSSEEDAYCPGPGFNLSFTRFFRSSIDYKNRLGGFGRGWTHNFEVILKEQIDGTVIINGPNGFDRIFTNKNGWYEPSAGDYGTLSTQQDGGFLLTEKDGTKYFFNLDGTLGIIQDRNNNQISLGYTSGLLTSIQHSSGDTFTLHYNNYGRISTLIDHDGRSIDYIYDGSGEHVVNVTTPGNLTTLYSYDITSNVLHRHALTSIIDPDGTEVIFTYDSLGRLVNREAGDCTENMGLSYGSTGAVGIIDDLGSMLNVGFDRNGLPSWMKTPSGSKIDFTVDSDGDLTKITAPTGKTVQFDYDWSGNLTRIIDFLNHQIHFTYHSGSHEVASITDPRGNSTHFDYDIAGNLKEIIYEDGSMESFGYNNEGLVSSYSNRQDNMTSLGSDWIEYTYNNRGQITQKDYYVGETLNVSNIYEYNIRGNLLSATNEHGTTRFEYDSKDFLSKVTSPSGRYLAFSYNNAGIRTRMVDQDGYLLTYAYDAAGRMAKINDGEGNAIVVYEYYGNGSLKSKTMENGLYTTYEYDLDGKLIHLVNYKPNGQVLSRFDYTYDLNGQRTSMTTLEGAHSYQYDANGQLIDVTYPDGRHVAYTYDAVGNRLSVNDNGIEETYTTNIMNQYTNAGGTTYTYDEKGNLASKTKNEQTTIYEYDLENRLIAVKSPEGTWRYVYDALGNRIASEHNGEVTHYQLDPTGLVNVVAEYDAYGNRLSRYVHGLGLTARIDAGGNPAFYTFDGNGNTSALIGMDLGVLNSYTYSPFGKGLSKTETIDNPFEFVGQFGVMDEGNGLQFMRARYYDVEIGRFMQPDPIGFLAGDVNLYRYVENNPLSRTDPWGLDGKSIPELKAYDPSPELRAYNPTPEQISRDEEFYEVMSEYYTNPPRYSKRADWADDSFAQQVWETIVDEAVGQAISWKTYVDLTLFFNEIYEDNNPNELSFEDEIMIAYMWWNDEHRPGYKWWDERTPPNKKYKVKVIKAVDPNDKLISVGFSTLFHILSDEPIEYTIRFENQKEATASAQLITVTDPLSPSLDLSTFELGDMEFGDHRVEVPEGLTYYWTQVDLRAEGNNLLVEIEAGLDPLYRLVTWTFTAIDPDTGELTEDPLAGFLPPNGDNHEGEGFVKFKISPHSDLSTGTKINNEASIVFDWNPPIDTPPVFNTIDSNAPSSQVQQLEAQSPQRFEVIWEGQDDEGGSGIAGFDIYVSENGGEYTLWLEDTLATSAKFFGIGNNTYAFYSVATDNVGLREKDPAGYDTITTALVNNQPSTPLPTSPIHMDKVIMPTPSLTINNSIDTDGDTLTYEFEIFANTDGTSPAFDSANALPEGDSNTSWACGIPLDEDNWYSWRARAFDGIEYSEWMPAAVFLVNEENYPPSDPNISSPLDQDEVDCLQPTLTVINSIDPDGESISYEFEVYVDTNMISLLTHTSLVEMEGTTSWMVTEGLSDNTWYYWRTRATDGEAFSDWSSGSFFVNNNGFDDPPEINDLEPAEDISTHADSLTISWQDDDPDSNADIALYYDLDAFGYNGILIADGFTEDPDGEYDSYLWDISTMAAGTYYLYAVITDDSSSLTSYSQGTVTIEALHTYYCDYDGDGYGDPNCTIQDYTKPANFAEYGIDCDDSDPNANPKEIEMISIENESLSDFTLGRNVLKVFNPSCYPYTSFDLLSDFKELGDSLDFHYRNQVSGTYKSTYWFFNRISGEKVDLEEAPPDGDPNALYIIDKSP